MHMPVFLSGEKILLCPVDKNMDLSEYLSWINNQETTLYMSSGDFPTCKEQLQAYIARQYENKNIFLGIFTKSNDKHIGNICLYITDHQSHRGEVAIMIGDKKARGKGYGLEALKLIIQYGFMHLSLNKLCAAVAHDNFASYKLFERAGFHLEATLREQFYLNRSYHNDLRYGLLRREYLEMQKGSTR